jgi:protein phosphatase
MQSLASTNIGKRNKNEDAFHAGNNLFIVCDGVGGAKYGEVASKLACSSFANYFNQNPSPVFGCEYLNKALSYTRQQFRETETKYPETKGMSTTVVLIAFDNDGSIIAWMGDSRLYHIRNGKILFVTEDDSLINQLSKKGEDISNVSRNIITKSLNAAKDDAFSFHGLSKEQIKTGDYFLLCTDGVLENIDEQKINRLFSDNPSLEELQKNILNQCDNKTNDNYTFQLIHI